MISYCWRDSPAKANAQAARCTGRELGLFGEVRFLKEEMESEHIRLREVTGSISSSSIV